MKTTALRTVALSALTSLTVGGSLLVAAAPAQADDRYCRGTIGAKYVDGNVIVPKGATCRLLGTRVDGNVEVKRNATLIARGIRVDGNLQCKSNDPRPVGANNRVDGNKEGQCKRM